MFIWPVSGWSHLFTLADTATSNDYNLALLLKVDNLGSTIRIAGMVDVAGRPPSHSGINNCVIVNPKHVHPTVLSKGKKKKFTHKTNKLINK